MITEHINMPDRLYSHTLFIAVTVILSCALLTPVTGLTLDEMTAAPDFTHNAEDEWLNFAPLTWTDLRGKVVLVDFWTFDCWNCYRSFPWLKTMEARLEPRGLQVIGVHTPEFDHEKVRKNVAAKVKEFDLHHPVMLDNDFSYWRALENRYWPAFYIFDKQGRLRATFIGETQEGDRQAREIEAIIKDLLSGS